MHNAVAKRSWLRISNEDSLPGNQTVITGIDLSIILVSKVKELERETERLYREGIAKLSGDAEGKFVLHLFSSITVLLLVHEVEESILWEKYILWSVERLQYWTRKKGQSNEVLALVAYFISFSSLLSLISPSSLGLQNY